MEEPTPRKSYRETKLTEKAKGTFLQNIISPPKEKREGDKNATSPSLQESPSKREREEDQKRREDKKALTLLLESVAKRQREGDQNREDMASRKRGNQRHDASGGEEQHIWDSLRGTLNQLAANEAKAKEVNKQIFELEAKIKAQEKAGKKPAIDEIDALGALYRENVKIAESSKELDIQHLISNVDVMRGLVSHNEKEKAPPPRTSNSRDSQSAMMEFDGPSDSPAPENKHVRKLGAGRTSSQPPREHKEDKEEREKETTNPGRTKITFAKDAEVAFKPKISGETGEHDWIQGVVVKVIGEGKSRRYDVKDPFPPDTDPNNPGKTPAEPVIHRSSASSMVPIPPEGAYLGDYEPGKRVLALYPGTSTFYRADVKRMVNGGAQVELQFEEEESEALLKLVDRRFVLDHKG